MHRKRHNIFLLIAIIAITFVWLWPLDKEHKNNNDDKNFITSEILERIESIEVYYIESYQDRGDGSKVLTDISMLNDVASFEIEKSELKDIMNEVNYNKDMVLWKGDRFAIAHLDDETSIRLRISYYGDFFSVIGYEGYFYFEEEYKEQWRSLVKM